MPFIWKVVILQTFIIANSLKVQNNSYRQELKGKILEVASGMFHAQGIKLARMDDIAHALSISKRTLYEIYDNKEQLLMDVVKYQAAKHKKSLEEFANTGASTIAIIVNFYRLQMKELSDVNPTFFEDLHAYSEVIDYLLTERERNANEGRQFISKAIKEGYFSADFNYDVISIILEASSEYVIRSNMFKQYGLTTLFHNIIMLFLRGACTEKGLHELDEFMKNF